MHSGDDDGFDWAALKPQGSIASNGGGGGKQAPAMRLDDDMARALADAGAGAIDASYVGPLGVWSTRVHRTTDHDFAQRANVRQECSTGCLDLQGNSHSKRRVRTC